MGSQCCSSKNIPPELKKLPFELLVEKAMGRQGESQLNFLNNTLRSAFPNVSIAQATVPSNDPSFFNVFYGNTLLHDSSVSGPIQNNSSNFFENLLNALRNPQPRVAPQALALQSVQPIQPVQAVQTLQPVQHIQHVQQVFAAPNGQTLVGSAVQPTQYVAVTGPVVQGYAIAG